jgi:hypothetical protein
MMDDILDSNGNCTLAAAGDDLAASMFDSQQPANALTAVELMHTRYLQVSRTVAGL